MRFNITNIRLLDDVKGKLIRNITIDLPTDKLSQHVKELLEEQLNSATQGDGELAFRIFDPSINRSLHLSSARRIPITRGLVEALKEEDVNFSIND